MTDTSGTAQPRIARIRRGRTTRERADEYARYLYEHGIKPLEEKALGVQLLQIVSRHGRCGGDGAE
jgi:hypothetical protein